MLNILFQKKKPITATLLFFVILSNLMLPLAPKKNVFAEEGSYYAPRYPERLKDITTEIHLTAKDLVYSSQQLKDLTANCNCSNAKSQCGRSGSFNPVFKIGSSPFSDCVSGSPKAFSEACPERKTIEKTQKIIREKTDQLSYLRKLLIKERDNGLESELKTLRTSEEEKLRNGVKELIDSTGNIVPLAMDNVGILDNDKYSTEKKCGSECKQGVMFKILACILPNLGEQDPFKFIFKVGVGLKKLDLGEVKATFGINLPEKINIANVDRIKDVKVRLPSIDISLENKKLNEPIIIHPSSPEMPSFPDLNLPCPKVSDKTYNCQPKEKKEPIYYIEAEWYSQTFSWLSEKCQEIPGMTDKYKMPSLLCLDINNVHSTIIQKCDSLWNDFFNCELNETTECVPPSGICASIGPPKELYENECNWPHPCTRAEAEKMQCQKLFSQLKESPSAGCGLYALQNKCQQLKEKKEKIAPEPCKFIPLFTGSFKKPNPQENQGDTDNCPKQDVSDNTGIGDRMDCPLSFPSVPKIKLPDIKIPDIYLPTFSFMPFFKIKLPNFIFEDLHFPDMDLCNLDDCKNLIPSLDLGISSPNLSIPSIKTPSIPIPGGASAVTGGANISLKLEDINFPPMPIPMPKIDLSNLLVANIDIPKISLPRPKIIIEMLGVKINSFDLLLGLVASLIHIPGGCISAKIFFIPLVIAFPDFYFYWPKFPKIPDLCNNEYISVNEYCRTIKNALDKKNYKIAELMGKIKNVVDKAVDNNLQKNINLVAEKYNELISESVDKYIRTMARIEGKRLIMEGGEITIPMGEINNILSRIPTEIKLPWPDELKEEANKVYEVSYKLPSIPLDRLSYTKKVEIKIPGFQLPSLKIVLDTLGKYPSCEGTGPSGGNPYPIDKINANMGKIKDIFKNKIDPASKEVQDIL